MISNKNNRNRCNVCETCMIVAAFLALAPLARAQDQQPTSGERVVPAKQQSSTPKTNAAAPAHEADDDQPTALVIGVAGQVHWAAAGTSPLATTGWTSIEIDNKLAPGTLIRTGLRSHVNLQFGETTTVSVRSISYASIDQFYRSATTETVRVGLGYGTVRGGSSEGEIHADVEVSAPVATLAKRGTQGWQIAVEQGTGRFRISLAEHGLVDAIQTLHAKRTATRSVRPGQYASAANIANMWIDQDIFDRNIEFFQSSFVTGSDAEFLAKNQGGYATLAPGGGSELATLSGRSSRDFALGSQPLRVTGARLPVVPIGVAGPFSRPEGNFGTGGIFKRRRK